MTRTLVAVSAGLSQPSSTRLLADNLAAATVDDLNARPGGDDVIVTVVELRELAHDIINHLLTGFASPVLQKALDAVATADGVIAVTPVFAASYSGLFKSFVDLIEPGSLAGLPILIAATGGTARHSLATEYAMRPLFTYLRADVVPTAVFAATSDWGSSDGEGDSLSARIDRAAAELAEAMFRRAPRSAESAEADVITPFAELLASLDGVAPVTQ
jgi:FMN reductase